VAQYENPVNFMRHLTNIKFYVWLTSNMKTLQNIKVSDVYLYL